jgi:hypothetical protein
MTVTITGSVRNKGLVEITVTGEDALDTVNRFIVACEAFGTAPMPMVPEEYVGTIKPYEKVDPFDQDTESDEGVNE